MFIITSSQPSQPSRRRRSSRRNGIYYSVIFLTYSCYHKAPFTASDAFIPPMIHIRHRLSPAATITTTGTATPCPPSSSSRLYGGGGGGLGNDDFSRIFGKQEAAERKMRDISTEYLASHPMENNKNKKTSKDLEEEEPGTAPGARAATVNNTTKVVRKYVPPPSR